MNGLGKVGRQTTMWVSGSGSGYRGGSSRSARRLTSVVARFLGEASLVSSGSRLGILAAISRGWEQEDVRKESW